ncbi:MAG: DUF4493 domain-containing protein [Bacteroidales bacterium]|nr:DUF4493 domain-containing protein [Bacteroidales bacterium]MBD5219618.1 DUF4493 domain-containing protein [Bacteroidales bacterium]
MKTNILSFFVAAVACVGMTACGDDNWNSGDSPETYGSVSLAAFKIDVDGAEKLVSRADGISTDNFKVNFLDKNTGEVKYKYTYGDMPEVVSIAPGSYTLSVKSHEVASADWDAPYFVGGADFTVETGKITEIGTVLCKFSNIKVTVKYTNELLGYMGQDARVRVIANDRGSLDFTATETRAGYFEAVDGSSTIVAVFQATIQGNYVETIKTFTDVKAGQHYVITFSVQNGSGTIPDEFGTIGASGIKVDADIEHEDLGGAVDVSPEKPTDPSERPGNEEWPDEPTQPVEPVDPTDPTKPDQPGQDEDAITFKYNGEEVIGDEINDTAKGLKYVININSSAGISSLNVEIKSDNDFFMSSAGSTVPLNFDLADIDPEWYLNEDSDKSVLETLQGMNLPVNDEVVGKNNIDFDVSGLVPLLAWFEGVHTFVVTVKDSKGQSSEIKLVITSDGEGPANGN